MKLLFLFLTLAAGLIASSQNTSIVVPKEKIEELNRLLKDRKFTQPGEFKAFFDSVGMQIIPAENSSPRVYNLPQDNMPCIVPAMNLIKQMPNGMTPRIPFKTEIPNAAPNQKLDPKKLNRKPVYFSGSGVNP